MKKIAIVALSAMMLATLVSCGDDSYDHFEVRMGGMKSADGSKGQFDNNQRIYYFNDGETVYLNNGTITLSKDESQDGDGTDVWMGTANRTINAVGGLYYGMYSEGGGTWNASSKVFEDIDFVISHDSKIVLGTTTSNNVLTMWPGCAMLIFSPTYRDDIQVYFNLTDGHIPTYGCFNPADRSVSNYTEFSYYTNTSGAPESSAGVEAEYIKATSNNARFNYVLVPMTGSSITGKIIIRYSQVQVDASGNETITYKYQESNAVTLRKGYRYTI